MDGCPVAAAGAGLASGPGRAARGHGHYRLLLPEGLWHLRTEGDTQHPPAHGYVILPRELRPLEPRLERFYSQSRFDFVDDTASAITDAAEPAAGRARRTCRSRPTKE